MVGLKQILGVGAAMTAAWLCKESYKGSAPGWREKFVNHEAELMYDYNQYGWGHFSGQPTMDHWSHKLFGLKLFGLFGSKSDWQMVKIYTEGLINDVLLPNLTPIALGIGGLYAGFGRALNKPFIAFYKWLRTPGPTIFTPIWAGIKQGARAIGSVAYKGLDTGINCLVNRGGWGSTVLAGVLLYGLYRFWRVHTHQEQHELFKDFVSGVGKH